MSISMIVFANIIAACSNNVMDDHQGEKAMPAKSIKEVISERAQEMMSIQGVVGMAQGLCDDKPCILVLVIKKTPELEQKIPDVLEGYPVEVKETGEIWALPADP